jgi:ATP-dependent helicase HepA
MLVVDEAHHLEWAGIPSPQYALVERLSRETRGLLLLTATPEQLGEENHFARLRLLDPDRYPSFESYQQEAAGYRHIAEVAGALLDGKMLTQEQGKDLARFLPRSAKLLQARLKAVLAGDEAARAPFIEDLIDQHGPGRVVFRNARSVLDSVPERGARGRKLDWPAERGELFEKLAQELVADTRETGLSLDHDYAEDPRAKWLQEFLVELAPEKVLVLCRFKEKAIALKEALRVRSRFPVAVFHEDLSLLQRDRNAAWFANEDDDGAQALLCSEIGSEGRNFQFAHHLVLFDLPLNPELLEQRIGRLYRIGQQHNVEIHVPFLPGSPQEMLYRWYHEGLDAFEKSLPSGAYFDELAELVRKLAVEHVEECDPKTVSEPPKDMARLLERTRSFRKEVIAKLQVGRDRLLELGSFRRAAAEALVADIRQTDEDKALDRYVQDALGQLGVELEEVSARTFVFRKGNQLTVDDLPGLRGEEVGMTADRDKATHQGELDFLTWDHPMVTGVMDLIVSSERGNSAVACVVEPGAESLLLEAVFVLDVVAPPALYTDRFLPPMPLRVVVDQSLRDLTDSLPPGKLKQKIVDGRQVLRLTDRSWQDELLPKMIVAARELAEKERPRRIEASLFEMQDVMGKELRRLKALAEVNHHVRPDEIDRVEAETRDLKKVIESAQLRLDALRLIWKTPTPPRPPR